MLALMLALSGCVGYEPKPIDLQESRRQFEIRSLQDKALMEEISSTLAADSAASARDGVWDRSALLLAALRLSPNLIEARARLYEAVAATKTAQSLPNVTVGLSSEYNLSQAEESPWLWGISTDFLLDAVFQRELKSSIASSQVRIAQIEYAEAVWDVRKEIRAATLALYVAENKMSLLNAASDEREQLAELIRKRRELGEASPIDQLQGQLEAARARVAKANAQSDVDAARARLASAIGIPLAALDAIRFATSDWDSPQAPSDERLRELQETALLSRADISRAIAEYSVRELELRQQVRLQYPQLSIGPGFTWDHGIRKATLGVSLSAPLFSGNRGPIGEADARRESAGEHLLAVQASAINEMESSRRTFRHALDSLYAAVEESTATESVLKSVETALRVGSEDRVALMTARLAANTDQLALLDAVERAQQALGQWEDSLRTPLMGPETTLQFNPPATH